MVLGLQQPKHHVSSMKRIKELHIDRAYLISHLVRERSDDLEVYCKAWPVLRLFLLSFNSLLDYSTGVLAHLLRLTVAACPG